jgi:hypothetical protein
MNILLKDLILREDENSQHRSFSISKDDFDKKLGTDHATAYNKYKLGNRIYRGYNSYHLDSPFLFIQPSLHYRPSKNTNNFYTALIDVLPSWKDWPKRSQSIVCTNSYSTAQSYGNPYVVLPKNQAKIAICPKNDFWVSFKNIPSMNSFNHVYTRTFSTGVAGFQSSFDSSHITPEDVKRLLIIIDKMPRDAFLKRLVSEFEYEGFYRLRDYTRENLTDGNDKWTIFFDKLLDPVFNEFKLKTIENYNLSHSSRQREIWTDADSVGVDANSTIFNRDYE